MPPIRRTGSQGPRPSRRPRVAGTRPAGAPETPPTTDVPTTHAPTNAPTTDAPTNAPTTDVPALPEVPVAPVPAPAAQDSAPSVVEPEPAMPVTAPEPAATAPEPTIPVTAPVLRKPRPAAAAVPEPEADAVVPDATVAEKTAAEKTAAEKSAAETVAAETVAAERTNTDTATRPGPRRAVLVGMAVLTVLLAAFAVVAATQPGVSGAASDNTALVDRPATDEAAAAAVAAVQRTYSYSFGTIDADLAAAVALMTPEMAAKHEQNFATIRDAVTQAQTTTTAQVTADGVRYLDGERAEVVAFVVVSGDNAGVALSAVPLRFSVVLTRVDGSWKMAELNQS